MTISHTTPNQLRPSGDGDDGPIIRVGPDRLNEAVARLLATGPHADREHSRRFLEYARDHRINLSGLWACLDRQGRIEAAVLGVPSPGRTAMVFASRAYEPRLAGLVSRTLRYATAELVHDDVNLAQALLDPAEQREAQVFYDAGYLNLALLSYLERPLRVRGGPSQSPQWPVGISVHAYDQSMRDELIDVLNRSYEATLDCPGLRGRRTTNDILTGHQASGRFDEKLWTIVRHHDVAIGAVLLNPAADHYAIELVYLGLASSWRGKGLGRQLLRHAFKLVEHRTERMMTLAVDEANAPAMRLYEQEGFHLALRRRALICPV